MLIRSIEHGRMNSVSMDSCVSMSTDVLHTKSPSKEEIHFLMFSNTAWVTPRGPSRDVMESAYELCADGLQLPGGDSAEYLDQCFLWSSLFMSSVKQVFTTTSNNVKKEPCDQTVMLLNVPTSWLCRCRFTQYVSFVVAGCLSLILYYAALWCWRIFNMILNKTLGEMFYWGGGGLAGCC